MRALIGASDKPIFNDFVRWLCTSAANAFAVVNTDLGRLELGLGCLQLSLVDYAGKSTIRSRLLVRVAFRIHFAQVLHLSSLKLLVVSMLEILTDLQ